MSLQHKKLIILAASLLLFPFIVNLSLFFWDNIQKVMEFLNSYEFYAILFGLATILGGLILYKAKGKSLPAIFITSMGFLLFFSCIYLIP